MTPSKMAFRVAARFEKAAGSWLDAPFKRLVTTHRHEILKRVLKNLPEPEQRGVPILSVREYVLKNMDWGWMVGLDRAQSLKEALVLQVMRALPDLTAELDDSSPAVQIKDNSVEIRVRLYGEQYSYDGEDSRVEVPARVQTPEIESLFKRLGFTRCAVEYNLVPDRDYPGVDNVVYDVRAVLELGSHPMLAVDSLLGPEIDKEISKAYSVED